jgi:hypothetical protein
MNGAPGPELLGKWLTGHVSSIQYKSRTTGVSAPTNGQRFEYDFRPDGTYSFTGLMQFTSYNCTNSTFSNETGTYTVQGDVVSLRPEKNPYRMTNNCAPSSNKEAPGKLINRSYRFRFTSDSGGRNIELISENGSSQVLKQGR